MRRISTSKTNNSANKPHSNSVNADTSVTTLEQTPTHRFRRWFSRRGPKSCADSRRNLPGSLNQLVIICWPG
ncbi:unnamed protein product [Protopolystoma xenopodis]|uniref:Uncharacterized protein n=1 Tax=Protopolystoma xenopodis TaxID=117903 RepID=A0A448X996_9PLAT|nr:unnamed protein product [Protopolystoma xenopodis]